MESDGQKLGPQHMGIPCRSHDGGGISDGGSGGGVSDGAWYRVDLQCWVTQ